MHRSLLIPVLLSFLNCRRSEARPAPQADAAPCPTTVFLPEATLTANPGPSKAVINGLLDGATSTIEVNGPAISIGPNVLSLNDQLNLVLDGIQYEFSDVCPAMLIPITTPGAIASGEPESSPTAIVPVVPGPTGTPGEEENNNDDDNNNNNNNNNDDNNNNNNNNNDDDNNNNNNNNNDDDDGTPVIPVVPVITTPPTPPVVDPNDPNNDNPEECETKTASVCNQGCSFGVNDLGVTTTSSCKDPTCTATTGCTVSDTTTTTTIEPPSCSLAGNGVAAQYPFAIGDDGPLPTLLKPEAGAPIQADPQPTNSPEPTQPDTEQPDDTTKPVKPPTQIYEVGSYINNEAKGIWAIFRYDKGGKVNVCGDNADKPMFEGPDLPAPEVLLNLVDAVKLGGFDLPDSYPACNFEANDPQQDGVILCDAQPEIKCKRTKQNSIGSCLVGSASFQALWICNE